MNKTFEGNAQRKQVRDLEMAPVVNHPFLPPLATAKTGMRCVLSGRDIGEFWTAIVFGLL